MKGQGLIVGVGRIDYPAAFEGTDPEALTRLGVSKTVTITSTYDHRIIQGAESGMFLQQVHELLIGGNRFYEDVFASLDVPYVAVQWRMDHNPTDELEALVEKQTQVDSLINMYRVRGPPDRRSRPVAHEGAPHARGARPRQLRADHLGPRPGVPHRRSGGPQAGHARRHPRHPARRLLPHDRRRVHAHPGARREALDPVPGRGHRTTPSTGTSSCTSSTVSTRPRRSRSSSPPATSPRSASASRAPRRRSRSSTPSWPTPRMRPSTRPCSAWPTAAG